MMGPWKYMPRWMRQHLPPDFETATLPELYARARQALDTYQANVERLTDKEKQDLMGSVSAHSYIALSIRATSLAELRMKAELARAAVLHDHQIDRELLVEEILALLPSQYNARDGIATNRDPGGTEDKSRNSAIVRLVEGASTVY